MNIGILAQLRQKNLTGINRVTVGTLGELLKVDKGNSYSFLGETDWLPLELPTVDLIYDSAGAIHLNYALLSHPFDVVHSHYRPFEVAKNIPVGKIITIHDLIPFLHPEWNNNLYDFFDGPLRQCAKDADIIIAVSECTKKDVVEAYGINAKKIKVIYSGLYPKRILSGNEVHGAEPVKELENDEFLLSVSAVGANKNQCGVIDAFVQFKIHHPENELRLVLAGPVRQYDIVRKIEQEYSGYKADIIFTGFVSDEKLSWLYQNAVGFIYASFYEGFGLPILEALSFGKAVICSDTSSMPEVGGDAVEYCNPYDVDSMESAIANVVLNESRRVELEGKALSQAAKFSYEKTARETLGVYRMFE